MIAIACTACLLAIATALPPVTASLLEPFAQQDQQDQQNVQADARERLAAGDAAGAIELLEPALVGAAGDVQTDRALRLLLAEAQVAAGQAEHAVVTLDSLDARKDHDTALQLGRAHLAWAAQMEAAGAPSEDIELTLMDARRDLQRALGLAPTGSAEAAIDLGNLELWRFGDPSRAYAVAQSTLETVPDNGELLLLSGNCRLLDFWNASQTEGDSSAAGLFEEAVRLMRAADTKLPRKRVDAQQQLQWLHETRGNPGEAVAASIAVIERAPDASFDEIYRLARRYASERRFDASGPALAAMVRLSARDLTQRVAAEPQLDAVALELSWSIDPFYTSGDRATARNILGALVAAEPSSRDVWYNYSVLCQETGSFDDAETAYARLIELDPDDPRPYNDLATMLKYDLERDFERATELYDRCIALADEQLAAEDLDPARRNHLATARQLASDNRDNDSGSPIGGFFDRLRDGLRGVTLPGSSDEDADEGS